MSIYKLYFNKKVVIVRNTLLRLNRDLLLIQHELLEQIRDKS